MMAVLFMLTSGVESGGWMKRSMVLMVFCVTGFNVAQAGGFQIGEMASRATGMGGAFTAVADDASAAWYNPAGVAFSTGSQVMAGGAVIVAPGTDYSPNASTVSLPGFPASAKTSSQSKTFVAPHLYYTHWDEHSGLGSSISINAPYGLETRWSDSSSLASSNTFSKISMLSVNPSVIFKLTDNLALSGGFSYAYLNSVNLDNAFQRLEGRNKNGWGGTASLMLKQGDVTLGVNYRSRIAIDIRAGKITGGAALAAVPVIGPSLVGAVTSGNTAITLPDQISVGLAWQINKQWLISGEVDWVNWKTFDAIQISYAPSTLSTVLTTGSNSKTIPENWKATTTLRLGAEWQYQPDTRFRAGYVFDPSPIPDATFSPSIPGNDRHLFSLGYSHDLSSSLTIDLAYAYVYFQTRKQTTSTGANAVRNGSYKTGVHIAAASLQTVF